MNNKLTALMLLLATAVLSFLPTEIRGDETVPSDAPTTAKGAAPNELSAELPGKGSGQIRGVVTDDCGVPFTNAFVMTDNGMLAHTGKDGVFSFHKLSDAKYSVKTVALGMEDSISPGISIVNGETASVCIAMEKSKTPCGLVAGCVKDKATGAKIPAYFELRDSAGPIRWFDVTGNPYGGRDDVAPGVWHQKNRRYWTSGDFAFSARPGKLQVAVKVDGYVPSIVTMEVQAKKKNYLEIEMSRLFEPSSEGWFKGDFHAHGFHGENIYTVNIPFIAFILRAEGYRWFYLSSRFNNDGLKVDNASIALQQRGEDLFLALNSEYPKTTGGHVGNVGIDPPEKALPYPNYSNMEAIKTDIIAKGGAAIPVHPLCGHMRYRELPFTLLGAPEFICGFDFYTSWNAKSERLWADFLNRGYKLCRTATSDAAFDLGRSPGTMGATFINPEGGVLNRESIVSAFKKGRTTISWDGALLIFKIDGRTCGETFPSGQKAKKASIALHYIPKAKVIINVSRNGMPFKQLSAVVPPSGKAYCEFDVIEKEKAWYSAMCSIDGKPDKVIAASSPFYFGDWKTPAPVTAKIEMHVFDANTKAPLTAEIEIIDAGKTITFLNAENGKLLVEARLFQRLRAKAKGYKPMEKSILGAKEISSFISSLSEEDLLDWDQYEKGRALLKHVKVDLPMEQK